MAYFRWQGNGGGTKSDYQDGRNWVNEAGTAYAQARYPGSMASVDDDAVFDTALVAGASSCTTNVNQSSAAAVLRSFRVGSAYDGNVGSTASDPSGKLKVLCTEMYIDGSGGGSYYIFGVDSGSYIATAEVTGGTVNLDGHFGNLTLKKGTITLASTTHVVSSLDIRYVTSLLSDAAVTITSGATLPSAVNVYGGTTTNANAITTLTVYAGNWTQTAGDITTLTNEAGTIAWNAGNITTANLNGGSLSGAAGAITRRIGTATLRAGATLTLDNGLNNIKVVNYVQNYGGTITWPSGNSQEMYVAWQVAGASDAHQGIDPQSSGAATLNGDFVYMNPYDRLDLLVSLGATDSSSVIFKLTESSDESATGEADISGKTVTYDAAAKQGIITLRGYELTAAKPYVRARCVIASGSASLVSAAYIIREFV